MTETSSLVDVLVLLIAAVLAVPIFQRLRVGPVLGYLVAGVVIGPYGLRLIANDADIRHLAELGVVFLLFAIGLELKLSRLLVMRRLVFGLGSLQVLVTGAILAVIAWSVGVTPEAAVVAGAALGLSSTAVVLQILTERGELNSRTGRVAFAILLMQDLAVVPLLSLVSILSGEAPSISAALGLAALQAAAVVVGIIAVGRFLLRPVLRLIAASNSTEIFAAAAVLVVLGTSWLTAQVGLSMALGAFLAGLMLAETEFRHQVEADILPFRGFLLGLFFMTVGMSVDLGLVMREAATVAAIVIGLVATKFLVNFGLCRLFGFSNRVSIHAGMLLAQGGEFGFVLFGLAGALGVMALDLTNILILSISLTMIATPFLAALAARISAGLPDHAVVTPSRLDEAGEMSDHVIIAGFGRVGQTVARMLEAESIPYLALDLHADRVAEGLTRGLPVFYADASRPEVLRLAGAAHARAVVLTLDHAGRAERAVSILRQAFPELRVFARARDRSHSKILQQVGATQAVPETLEASLQLGATVLRAAGVTSGEVGRLLDEFRADDYARLDTAISNHPERRLGSRKEPAEQV